MVESNKSDEQTAWARFASASERNRVRKIFNLVDPSYWAAFAFCLPLLRLPLNASESRIVEQNIEKYRVALRIVAAFVVLGYWGISQADTITIYVTIFTLVSLSIPLITVWFALSFATAQEKHLRAVITLTRWLFAAFSVSLILSCVALSEIAPIPIVAVTLFLVAMIISAAVVFDGVDSLKIGLDDTLRRFGLTSLAKLGTEGFWPPIENDDELRSFMETHKDGKPR